MNYKGLRIIFKNIPIKMQKEEYIEKYEVIVD